MTWLRIIQFAILNVKFRSGKVWRKVTGIQSDSHWPFCWKLLDAVPLFTPESYDPVFSQGSLVMSVCFALKRMTVNPCSIYSVARQRLVHLPRRAHSFHFSAFPRSYFLYIWIGVEIDGVAWRWKKERKKKLGRSCKKYILYSKSKQYHWCQNAQTLFFIFLFYIDIYFSIKKEVVMQF